MQLVRIVTLNLLTNSFSIFKFKNSNVRIEALQSMSALKISLEKYKSWLSEFYTI